jgi:DeoR/GlpR family transcriptional regulator of sugar metabolism
LIQILHFSAIFFICQLKHLQNVAVTMGDSKHNQRRTSLSEGARYKLIFGLLEKGGEVLTNSLVAQYGMSYATWHRDLQKLAKEGKLEKTTSGAIKLQSRDYQINDDDSSLKYISPATGLAVAQICASGRAIIFDGSPYTIHLARQLPDDFQSTVITNSPQVAIILAGRPRVEIIVSGGRLRANSLIPGDPEGYNCIRKVNADLCILGSGKLHHEKGITVADFDEVTIKEVMIESSSKVALLATAETLNSEECFRVAGIDKLTHLILLEDNIPADALRPYEEQGIKVIRP